KIYLRIYTPSTGEYWYLMIHNQGINMSGVNTSASNCVEWDDDVNLGMRVVADVFDLDHDKDGVVDYMEELPDYAVVNQWVNVPSGAENMPYSVMASWSDAVFQIDPTKFVGYVDEDGYTYKRDAQGNNIGEYGVYEVEGYVLNYVTKVQVEVPATAARLVMEDSNGIPMISGSGLSFPLILRADEVEDFTKSLPGIITVLFTDGNGDGQFSKTFDGTEGTGSGVVKWDASELSSSFDGGVYTLHLTFGDGIVANYYVDLPVTVIQNKLTGVRFLAGDGSYEQSTANLTFSPYEEIHLPTKVWATFGNSAPAIYNIKWAGDESSITPTYTGITYLFDAKVGNLDVGYYDCTNIRIEITSSVIADYKMISENGFDLVDLDLTFDPYHITGDADLVDSKNVNMYPRYLWIKYEGSSEYKQTRVEWALAGVTNNYKGGTGKAKFRITSDDEAELARIQAAGRQEIEVAVTIMDATVVQLNLGDLANNIDPMYLLYVKRGEDGEIVDYIEYTAGATRLRGILTDARFNLNLLDFDWSELEAYKPELVVYDTVHHKIVDPTNATDANCYPQTVSVTYRNGTVATFEAIVRNNIYDEKGGVIWNADNVSVTYQGGTQIATLTVGNEQGGYQTLDVSIEIVNRTVDSIDLHEVRSTYEFDPYDYTQYALNTDLYPVNGLNLGDMLHASKSEMGNVIFSSASAGYYPIEAWDLNDVKQSYEGGAFNAVAKIGNATVGYQYVNFAVRVEPKVIQTVFVSAFEFDPYGTIDAMDKANYPSTVEVRFTDGTYRTFNNVTWDLNKLATVWSYRGGESVVTAKIGNALGGYQEVDIKATVLNRTIEAFRINADGILYFDPYGIRTATDSDYSAADPRLSSSYPSTMRVAYVGDTSGTVDVAWDINPIINGYQGYKSRSTDANGEHLYIDYQVNVRAGTEMGGYQTGVITVRVLNREIESLLPAELTVDPYASDNLPDSVMIRFLDGTEGSMAVEWTNKNYDLYVLGRDVDNSHATIDARIGSALGGYQIRTVAVSVVEKIISEVYTGNEILAKRLDSNGNGVIDKEDVLVNSDFEYVVEEGGEQVTYLRESCRYEIDPLDGSATLVLVSKNVATDKTVAVRTSLPSVVVAYFNDSGSSRNLVASWDLSTVTGATYEGAVFDSAQNLGRGAMLAMGTAKVGYVNLEVPAVILNRKVAVDSDSRPIIYTAYDEATGGKRLNSIIDDDFDSTVFPNILYFAYGSTAYQDAAVLSRIVSWTQDGDHASVVLGNQTYGYQTFTFPVYKVTRTVSYDCNVSLNVDALHALAASVSALNVGEGDTAERDAIAAYFNGVADGTKTLAEYTAYLGRLQALTVSRTSTVALTEAINAAISLKEKLILMVDPYNIVLPDTLTVTIGRAMYNGAFVNCRELGCEDCDCTDCVDCDCWCRAYTYTMAVDWSKAAINYDYTMAGTTQYIHNVLVGDRTLGYFSVNAYVEIEERYIKGVERAEFDIDPYDNAALPGEIGVLYKNNTAGTLSVLANISNAVRVTRAMVEDPNSIAYGHEEYINTNSFFYQGGYYVLTVKVGSRLGGYQEVDMLLNVADRTIKSISGKTYTADGLFVQEITPYGQSGETATPPTKLTVIYKDRDASGNYLTGELNVLWSYANINYHYLGNESDAFVLVGNAQGGYQTIPVHVVVARMVADHNLSGATANVALNADGQPFAYNPYVAEGTTPKKVKVFFNGSPNSAIVFDVADGYFRLKTEHMDYSTEYVDAQIRVGNNRSGYQWVDVRIPMADTSIKDTVVKTVTVNPYTNPLTWDQDGLLYLGGQVLTVGAHLGDGTDVVNMQAKLAEDFSYDYRGLDTVRVAVKLGNALGGYQEFTADGDRIYIFVRVAQEMVTKVEMDRFWLDLVSGGSINPYLLPDLIGQEVVTVIDGNEVKLTVGGVQYLDLAGNVLESVGYDGSRNVKVRVLVGNDVGGYQPVMVTTGDRELTLRLKNVKIDMTDVAFTSQFETWVDPYQYVLPTTIAWGGYAYDVKFINAATGAELRNSDIAYAGGTFQVIA
ncbi:MAG: hypothetical protein J5755_02555, partial [Clostridia bacterium]|nr:hypothetical protein [Clostridia bacterium]